MLLTFDVGNTETTLGLFDGDTLRAHWRMLTEAPRSADEVGGLLRGPIAGADARYDRHADGGLHQGRRDVRQCGTGGRNRAPHSRGVAAARYADRRRDGRPGRAFCPRVPQLRRGRSLPDAEGPLPRVQPRGLTRN